MRKLYNFSIPLLLVTGSALAILMQSFYVMSLFGLSYDDKITIYALFNFLTEQGRFDDFYNTINLVDALPNPGSGYLVTPFVLEYSRLAHGAPFTAHLFFAVSGIAMLSGALKLVGPSEQGNLNLDLSWVILIGSYPVIFAVSRGNAELWSTSLALLAVLLFLKTNRRPLAICFFYLACSIKPTVFFLVLLFDIKLLLKYWRIGVAFCLFNIALIAFSGISFSDYVTRYFASLQKYHQDYVIGGGGDLFNNSWSGLAKFSLPLLEKTGFNGPFFFVELVTIFVIMISVSLLLYRQLKGNAVGLYHLALAVITPIIIAPVAPDYRLIGMVIVFALALQARESVVAIISGFIIFPKHFVFFQLAEFPVITIQSLLNPIALVILFGYCVARILWISLLSQSDDSSQVNYRV